jgi:hypothetical protein
MVNRNTLRMVIKCNAFVSVNLLTRTVWGFGTDLSSGAFTVENPRAVVCMIRLRQSDFASPAKAARPASSDAAVLRRERYGAAPGLMRLPSRFSVEVSNGGPAKRDAEAGLSGNHWSTLAGRSPAGSPPGSYIVCRISSAAVEAPPHRGEHGMNRLRNAAEIDLHDAAQFAERFAVIIPPQLASDSGIRFYQLEWRIPVDIVAAPASRASSKGGKYAPSPKYPRAPQPTRDLMLTK